MKRLVPIPLESAKRLEEEKEVGPGYHFVSVSLKDGRNFESAVASEGFIIQVKGYRDAGCPFAAEEVESVEVTEKGFNFRRKKKEDRPQASSASA